MCVREREASRKRANERCIFVCVACKLLCGVLCRLAGWVVGWIVGSFAWLAVRFIDDVDDDVAAAGSVNVFVALA